MCLEDFLPREGKKRDIYNKLLAGETLSKEEAYSIGSEGDNHGNYPHKYAFSRDDLISGRVGVHSVVFSLAGKGKDLVSKFPKIPQNWHKVERGEVMQKKAYDLEVKVAKPEGLYKIFDLNNKKFYSGFVMEHLGMLPLNELRKLSEDICEASSDKGYSNLKEELEYSCVETQKAYQKALEGYDKAKFEAELKGFSKIDYKETNAFWVPKINDIRMIDCDEWDYHGED